MNDRHSLYKAYIEQYDRLLKRGKNKRVALISVANKLVKQISAIVKYDRIYDENYKKIHSSVEF